MCKLKRNAIAAAALLSGCASTFDLEHNLSAKIGSRFEPNEIKNMKVVQRAGEKPSLYEFHSKKGKCTILVKTNPNTQIVEGWRYQTGSGKCKKASEFGHDW